MTSDSADGSTDPALPPGQFETGLREPGVVGRGSVGPARTAGGAVGSVGVATLPGSGPDDDTEGDLEPDDPDEPGSDWAWVDEWRRSEEPPAWTPGVTIAAFALLVVATAVFVLSVGLGDMPWLAIAANVVVAAGLAPALWLCRSLPVLRFLAGGAALGVVIGWIAALMG